MEERIIKVSLEKAREWYKSGNSSLKDLALQTFTENELKENYPKTFKEFMEIHPEYNGFILDENGIVYSYRGTKENENLNLQDINVHTSFDEAVAIQTLITLRLIRKVSYVKDWERNLNGGNEAFSIIYSTHVGWDICNCDASTSLFSFPTLEMARVFYFNFKDRFKKIEPLFK